MKLRCMLGQLARFAPRAVREAHLFASRTALTVKVRRTPRTQAGTCAWLEMARDGDRASHSRALNLSREMRQTTNADAPTPSFHGPDSCEASQFLGDGLTLGGDTER